MSRAADNLPLPLRQSGALDGKIKYEHRTVQSKGRVPSLFHDPRSAFSPRRVPSEPRSQASPANARWCAWLLALSCTQKVHGGLTGTSQRPPRGARLQTPRILEGETPRVAHSRASCLSPCGSLLPSLLQIIPIPVSKDSFRVTEICRDAQRLPRTPDSTSATVDALR